MFTHIVMFLSSSFIKTSTIFTFSAKINESLHSFIVEFMYLNFNANIDTKASVQFNLTLTNEKLCMTEKINVTQ